MVRIVLLACYPHKPMYFTHLIADAYDKGYASPAGTLFARAAL